MAKKATKATTKRTTKRTAKKAAKRSTAKRELLNTGSDARYTKRDASGQWSEMDDVGRSQRVDKPRTAKKTAKPGHGDQGDQPRRTKKAAKKR
jgi:hypothetical protein